MLTYSFRWRGESQFNLFEGLCVSSKLSKLVACERSLESQGPIEARGFEYVPTRPQSSLRKAPWVAASSDASPSTRASLLLRQLRRPARPETGGVAPHGNPARVHRRSPVLDQHPDTSIASLPYLAHWVSEAQGTTSGRSPDTGNRPPLAQSQRSHAPQRERRRSDRVPRVWCRDGHCQITIRFACCPASGCVPNR